MSGNIPVVIVAGPTASGKSGLALALAERLDGVVINADSMQVYRELRILTSRPDEAALARAPHRLYGVMPGAVRCSAGRWREMALAEIAAARSDGRLPLVVGGTGLYLKVLCDGLAPVPDIPPEIHAAAVARHRCHGGAAMLAGLAGRDPEAAARIAAGDSQRLIRAWEVLQATGRPLSHWQRQPADESGPTLAPFTILFAPPRDVVYATCDARFTAMLAAGALDEVRALAALELDPGLPIMKGLGVPELVRHLGGEIDLAAATAAAQQATRNYAKRQMTWFRNQFNPMLTISAQFSESLVDEIFTDIRQFLLTVQA